MNSTHKGQWRGALMFSFICVWINGWVSNREADDLRRYRAHYDVIVIVWGMIPTTCAISVLKDERKSTISYVSLNLFSTTMLKNLPNYGIAIYVYINELYELTGWVVISLPLLTSQIAKFMGPTRGPPGSCRPQMGPMLAPWTLLLGMFSLRLGLGR